MMTAGAWQVRITVDGDRGMGRLSVPVPTMPQATLQMDPALRGLLFAFMLLLCGGFITIVSTVAREATLGPGEIPGPRARRRGRIVGVVATCLVIAVVFLGNGWWTVEASRYARYVYKPLETTATVTSTGALRLTLSILLGQLFVKIHLASLELLNPLQPVRRESSFLEVVQDDDQQAGRDECDDDPTSAQCGPLRGGPGRPSSAVRAAPSSRTERLRTPHRDHAPWTGRPSRLRGCR